MSQYPPDRPPSSKSTNWVLIGCGGCLGLIVLLAIGLGALVFFGTKAVKASSFYTTALKAAKESPAVQEELGTPLTESAFPSGSVQTLNETGTADYMIGISGPKGKGKVHYVAIREAGQWHTKEHKVLIERNQRTIDLLQ